MPSRAERPGRRGRSGVSFTTRGSSIVAAAVAAAIGAVVLGETDLLRIAVIMLLVCLASYLLAWLMPVRVATTHRAVPPEAPIGAPVTVRVTTTVRRALQPATIVCHDLTSAGLAATGHLAVAGSRARDGVTLSFTTAARERGEHTAGPIEVSTRDPIGLVSTRRTGSERVTVLGLPRWYAVHPGWLRGSGPVPRYQDTPTDHGMEGDPDIGVREHRPEDGLRRIHWRTSARAGRLMTRLEEPQADRTASIGYESRARMHRGSTFETTLEIVASVGLALLAAGWELQLSDSTGRVEPPGRQWDAASLLRHLALAATVAEGSEPRPDPGDGPNLIVATSTPDSVRGPAGRMVVVLPPGQRAPRGAGVAFVDAPAATAGVLATAPPERVMA